MNNYVLLGILLVMMVLMLVLPSITNKKRIKEFNDMVDGLRVGDEIRTVGGVIGRIVRINNKDYGKTIVLETGDKGSKSTMEFDVAAVGLIIKSSSKKQESKNDAKVEEKQETIVEDNPELPDSKVDKDVEVVEKEENDIEKSKLTTTKSKKSKKK